MTGFVRILTMVVAGIILAAVSGARADTFTWDAGGGGNTNWSEGVNWTNTASPDTVPGAADDAVFNLPGTRVVSIGDTGDQSISNVFVTGSGAWTWTNNPALYKLSMSGQFVYGGSGSSVFRPTLDGPGSLSVTNGILQLATNNTFSGGVTLSTGGRLDFRTDNSLGSGTVSLGTATFGSVGNTTRTITNAVVLAGDTTFGWASAGNPLNLAFTGPTLLTGTRTLTLFSGGQPTTVHVLFYGPVGDGGNGYGIVKAGSPTLTLTNANTFSGGVNLTAGGLRVGHDQALGYGTLTLGTANIGPLSSTTRTLTNAVVLAGDTTFGYNGSGSSSVLVFNGPALLTGNRTLTALSDSSPAYMNAYFNSPIGDGGNGYGFVKTGGARIILAGANTFLGGVTVNSGYLRVANSNSHTGGTVIVGSTLEVSADNCLGYGPLTLGYINGYSGVGAYGGNYQISNAVSLAGNMYLQGQADSAVMESATARILTLTGPVMVNTPTPAWLSVATSRETRFTGPISAPYTYSPGLIKSGSGTLVMSDNIGLKQGLRVDAGVLKLTGDNAALAGNLVVNVGTLETVANGAVDSLGTNAISLRSATAILQLDSVAATDDAFGEVSLCGGQPTLFVKGVSGAGTWTVGKLTRDNRSILLIGGGTAATAGALTANDKLVLAADAPVPVNGMISPYFIEATSDFLTYDPATVGFKRATYVNTGDINQTGLTNKIFWFDTGAEGTMTADREVYALRGELNAVTSSGGTKTLTIGSGALIMNTGTSADKIYTANLKFGLAGEKEAMVYVTGGNNMIVTNATLTAAGGLVKSGTGPLMLSGDNSATLSGPVTINGGTLKLGIGNGIHDNFPLTVNGGALNLNTFSKTFAGLTMAGGTINNGSSAGVSTVNLACDVTYVAAGSGATIASAAGQVLSLNLNGLRTFDIADGAAGNDLTLTAPLLGIAGYTKSGNGRLYLNTTNAATLSGPITINGGTLWGQTVAGNGPFGATSSAIALSGNGAIVLEGVSPTTNGVITFAGGNLLLARNGQSTIIWRLFGLGRKPGSRGTLQASGDYTPSNGNDQFDVNNSLFITDMAVTNRLPACIVHTYNQTYNNAASHAQYSNGGATTVKFRSASYATVDINGSTATTLFNAATNQIMSNNRSCYYLRTAADISAAGAYTLTVAGEPGNEAGMIINGNNTITPAVTFGADAAREGVVFVNYGRTGRLNGSVTTSGGLTKFGAGMLVLGTDNSATLTGQISVNQGMLRLENANALAGASPIRIESGAMLAMTGSYTLQNAITGFGTIGTDTNVCTLGASGSISPGASVGTLTAEKLDFRGTYNWEYDGTNSDLIACTTLAFGSGSATLNCAYLGGGAAPQGVYPLFTYQGSAPSLPSWTVTPPSGLSGEVSVDDANKRVILTLGPVASGTLIMIR